MFYSILCGTELRNASNNSIPSTSFHIMFSIIVFGLFFCVASASPLLVGSEDWDSWFSSPSNTEDTQTVPQWDSMSFGNDVPSWSDLSSNQIGSDDDLFGSFDNSIMSEDDGSGIAMANSGSLANDEPVTDALISGPVPQATTDNFESYAIADQLAQIPTTPSPESRDQGFVPTTANPCPRIETYCCTEPQYTLILYLNKDSCARCMTHARNF